MKNPIRLLLASAALFLSAAGGHCIAASQVIIPLTGLVIQSGSTLLVKSTTAIDPAPIYYYSISGFVTGQNDLMALTGTGISLEAAFEATDPALVPYLQGFVLDLSSKFPYTAVNKLAKGTFVVGGNNQFTGDTVTGSVRAKAGIYKTGLCYGELTNISYKVSIGPFSIPIPKDDDLVFDSGQVLVQTTPITGPATANLSFVDPIGHVDGIGLSGTDAAGHSENVSLKKGKSASFVVAIQNTGAAAGSFILGAPPLASGFTQKFIYKTKNDTLLVTSENGFTLPPTGTLAPGGAATLTWKITNKDAVAGTTISPVLSAEVSGTVQDALVITGSAE